MAGGSEAAILDVAGSSDAATLDEAGSSLGSETASGVVEQHRHREGYKIFRATSNSPTVKVDPKDNRA